MDRPTMRPGELWTDFIARLEAWEAQGDWIVAGGGTERPFIARSGTTLLYCYQPRSRRHAYLDVGGDTILTDAQAEAHMGT